jgi:acyl-coenzyme A thioesterase PaaI-like protein
LSGASLWRDDGGCLVCGAENEHGLHLKFESTQDGARAEGVVPAHLQGFVGRSHGGIVAAVLDEAMYYAVAMGGTPGVATAEISVRYRRPLPTDATFEVEARRLRATRRFAKTQAVIRVAGEVVAEAEGTFLPVPSDIRFKGE